MWFSTTACRPRSRDSDANLYGKGLLSLSCFGEHESHRMLVMRRWPLQHIVHRDASDALSLSLWPYVYKLLAIMPTEYIPGLKKLSVSRNRLRSLYSNQFDQTDAKRSNGRWERRPTTRHAQGSQRRTNVERPKCYHLRFGAI